MWTLNQALELVRRIQPLVRPFNYHIAIGGGVLNNGHSDKDLDLYFIPFSEQGPDPEGLRTFLGTVIGVEYNLGGPAVRPADVRIAYEPEPIWVSGRYTYRQGDRRIDVFVA